MKKRFGKRRMCLLITTVLVFLLLVVCTLFGEQIYNWITPEVSVQMSRNVMHQDGNKYVCIPKSAVTKENTIYVVTPEQGFSRTIYRIQAIAIEYIDNEYVSSEVLTSTMIPTRSFIVTESETAEGLKDGSKVLIRKIKK